jgi:hypothetical protein
MEARDGRWRQGYGARGHTPDGCVCRVSGFYCTSVEGLLAVRDGAGDAVLLLEECVVAARRRGLMSRPCPRHPRRGRGAALPEPAVDRHAAQPAGDLAQVPPEHVARVWPGLAGLAVAAPEVGRTEHAVRGSEKPSGARSAGAPREAAGGLGGTEAQRSQRHSAAPAPARAGAEPA